MDAAAALGKKLTLNYTFIQIVHTMISCCVYSFATVFLLSRGFSNSMVGIVLTTSSGLSLFVQPVIAAYADRSRFSLRAITAVLLAATSFLSFILLIMPPWIIPTAVVYIPIMVLFGPQITLITSLAMEHVNNGVPVNFSLARGVASFTFAILSFVMGFLVDDFGAGVVMLINTGLGLVAILLVSTFKKPEILNKKNRKEEGKAAGLLEFALQNKRFLAVIGSVSIIFISNVLLSLYTIQIIENVGGDSSDMGIAIAIAAVVELPAMALFPLLFKRLKRAGLILKVSSAFFVIKIALTLIAPNVFWIMLAQSLQFFTFGLFLPASVYYVNQMTRKEDEVKGQALMSMSMGIGSMLGSLIGGFILDTSGGVSLMLFSGTIISLAGFILLLFIDRQDSAVVEKAVPLE